MKNKLFLLAAITLAFSISGCKNNSSTPGGNTQPGPGEKQVVELDASYSEEVSQGDTLNMAALNVVLVYDDETIENVKNSCSYYIDESLINIRNYVFNEPGNIPVVAKYKTFDATFIVSVTAAQDTFLHDIYFETKEVFDHKGTYKILFGFEHNGFSERWEMDKVSRGLYHYHTTWDLVGNVSFTALNDYSTKNLINETIPQGGNMFVIDSLTTGHWDSYSNSYQPIRASTLNASYQDLEVEHGSKIDLSKLSVSVTCSDESVVTVNDYKLYYKQDYNTKIYINDNFTFSGVRFNVGDTARIYAEGYGLETSFTVTIIQATLSATVYLNALCGFDFEGNLGIYAFVGEEGNEKMFKMEKVGDFEHIYTTEVKHKEFESLYVSFGAASKYSAPAHSYTFGLVTEKVYMGGENNMFGVARIDYETRTAYGPVHTFDENFDYDNDIIYSVSYDGWLTSLRGNLTYRQRLYDNRTQGLECDEIYYQNGENERRIDRIDGDGNVFDSYYIRSIFGHRYMYFIEGDVRRIEENDSESWWWRDSDDYRYTVNFHHHYTAGGMVNIYEQGFDNDILYYIDDPEHFMGGNVVNEGYQECYLKFENYQLSELIYIKGDNVFYFSSFSNWGKTISEPLNIPFGFHLNTEWFNVSYTIYNQNDEEVGSGFTDYYLQFANYELNVKQAYDELDVFGDENIYYYVIFSTTDNGRGDSVTTDPYYLDNVNENDHILDEVYLSISYNGIVSVCDLPPNQTAY